MGARGAKRPERASQRALANTAHAEQRYDATLILPDPAAERLQLWNSTLEPGEVGRVAPVLSPRRWSD
jgi:hypothetical protein